MLYSNYLKDKYQNVNTKFGNAEGVPCILKSSKGKNVKNYEIYGNSVQDGTPTPDSPIEIQSVGDLVTDGTSEYYGKYDIPIVVNDTTTTHIYLDKPLCKFGDYTDYIDFKNKKVVRNVVQGVLNGSESWNSSGTRYWYYNTKLNIKCLGNEVAGIKSNALPSKSWTEIRNSGTGIATYSDNRIDIRADGVWSTVDEAKAYMRQNPISYIAPCLVPTEEDISLPSLKAFKGTNIISVDTLVQPSNIKAKYVRL